MATSELLCASIIVDLLVLCWRLFQDMIASPFSAEPQKQAKTSHNNTLIDLLLLGVSAIIIFSLISELSSQKIPARFVPQPIQPSLHTQKFCGSQEHSQEHEDSPPCDSPKEATTNTRDDDASMPPTGGTYEMSQWLPIVGQQIVHLHILNRQEAHLRVDGKIVQINETIRYRLDTNGQFSVELSERTKKILRRFHTKLQTVGYDPSCDTAFVVVSPPLPGTIRLKLKRTTLVPPVA